MLFSVQTQCKLKYRLLPLVRHCLLVDSIDMPFTLLCNHGKLRDDDQERPKRKVKRLLELLFDFQGVY